MSTKQKRKKLLKAVLEEHETIDAILARVVLRLRDLDASRPAAEGLAGLQYELGQLHKRLDRHFYAEEGLGVHNMLREMLPDALAEIDGLATDHATVRRLLETVRREPTELGAGRRSELRKASALLLDVMAAHEATENALIARALRIIGADGGDD